MSYISCKTGPNKTVAKANHYSSATFRNALNDKNQIRVEKVDYD